VDFDAGTLTIARSRVEVGTTSAVVESEPKTASSRRTLPLDESLMIVLRRASARYAQEKLALGAAHADSGYVASTEAGHPYTPGARTHMWHELVQSAGVRRLRLHDARHSCGTALHLRGVPMAVIAKWLGHADASITAKIYAHSQDDELRAASATLGQVVSPHRMRAE
jgi:integrase